MIRDVSQEGQTARRIKSMDLFFQIQDIARKHLAKHASMTKAYASSLAVERALWHPISQLYNDRCSRGLFDKGVAMPLIHKQRKHTELQGCECEFSEARE